jgi:hypothetical protein
MSRKLVGGNEEGCRNNISEPQLSDIDVHFKWRCEDFAIQSISLLFHPMTLCPPGRQSVFFETRTPKIVPPTSARAR